MPTRYFMVSFVESAHRSTAEDSRDNGQGQVIQVLRRLTEYLTMKLRQAVLSGWLVCGSISCYVYKLAAQTHVMLATKDWLVSKGQEPECELYWDHPCQSLVSQEARLFLHEAVNVHTDKTIHFLLLKARA